MKNVIKLTVSAAAILGGAFVAAPAMAQGAPTVSGNVSLVTDYRFRGVTLSDNSPAIQGGVDLGWESGFYTGAWASSISSADDSIELDLYAGFGNELGDSGLSYDVGVLLYTYPGYDSDNFGDSIYPEIYGSLSGALNIVNWTVGAAYAPDTDNISDDNIYLFTDLEVPFGESPFFATGHLGFEDGAFGSEKFDWGAGVGASALGLDFGLSYVGFDSDFGSDDGIVLSVGSSW
jgi:uncharacterized protein (TIGR02001 family)